MFNRSIIIITLLFIGKATLAQLTYPDKHLPGNTPQILGVGIISDGLSNRDFTISPAGDEIFFTLQQPGFIVSTILYMRKQNGIWGKPVTAPFSGKYRDLEAAFSPDGKTVYFSSDRPVKDKTGKPDFDIWKVSRLGSGRYGEPENLGPVVNTVKNEFYPSVTKNGNLYFTVVAAYGKGGEDIVVCRSTSTGYAAPESLPEDINTKFDEFNAFVDPDEQFILFTGYGRPDDMGKGDMYLSRKGQTGKWLPAIHLPAPLNTNALDYCPYVTPDKRYLIFSSNRTNPILKASTTKNYAQLKTLLNSPGNGVDDIYWVKFEIADK
jgi:hypothetical protein